MPMQNMECKGIKSGQYGALTCLKAPVKPNNATKRQSLPVCNGMKKAVSPKANSLLIDFFVKLLLEYPVTLFSVVFFTISVGGTYFYLVFTGGEVCFDGTLPEMGTVHRV